MLRAILDATKLSDDTLNMNDAWELVDLLNKPYRSDEERVEFVETAAAGIQKSVSLKEV